MQTSFLNVASFGFRFVNDYLIPWMLKEKRTTLEGQPSFAKVSRAELAEQLDKYDAGQKRADKKDREARLSKTERDAIFEALAVETGSDLGAMTEAENRRCAVAAAAIIKATPDVTTADIKSACREYGRKFNGAAITTTAISSQWSKLYHPVSGRVGAPALTVYGEPPDGWRNVAKRMYPECRDWINPVDFDAIKWGDVLFTLRGEIIAELKKPGKTAR